MARAARHSHLPAETKIRTGLVIVMILFLSCLVVESERSCEVTEVTKKIPKINLSCHTEAMITDRDLLRILNFVSNNFCI